MVWPKGRPRKPKVEGVTTSIPEPLVASESIYDTGDIDLGDRLMPPDDPEAIRTDVMGNEPFEPISTMLSRAVAAEKDAGRHAALASIETLVGELRVKLSHMTHEFDGDAGYAIDTLRGML